MAALIEGLLWPSGAQWEGIDLDSVELPLPGERLPVETEFDGKPVGSVGLSRRLDGNVRFIADVDPEAIGGRDRLAPGIAWDHRNAPRLFTTSLTDCHRFKDEVPAFKGLREI